MNVRNNKPNVLVTGGTGGIGSAIVRRFFEAGYNVAIHYANNREKAEELADELMESGGTGLARIFRADFDEPGEIVEMFGEIREELGPVDVLINNAGIGRQELLQDVSYADWRKTFSVNVDAVFMCTKLALPYMIRRGYGRIVNISSIWGISGASCETCYSASKAAVIGFTKALAKEVGPAGTNVNCVAPGVIDTDMNSHLSPEDMSALADETPLGRIGTPYDVAETVYFLCSAASSFITGQVISPNGGIVI